MRLRFLAAPAVAAIILAAFATTSPGPGSASAQGACDPHYPDFCIPLVEGDVFDCRDDTIAGRKNFRAFEPDPHNLDQGGIPGVACEDDDASPYPTAVPTFSGGTNTLPTTPTPTPRGTWTALPATATRVPPTATPAPPTATPTATSAPATPTRTITVPLPPNTGSGSAGTPSPASLAIMGAVGTLIALAGGLAVTRKR